MSKFETEEDRWAYNAEDCVRTREVGEVEQEIIEKMNLGAVNDFQQALFWPVLWAMNRGVKIDLKMRAAMAVELMEELSKREAYFYNVLGHDLNPQSPQQMMRLFYEDLGIPAVMKRDGPVMKPTCNDDALQIIKMREPVVAPLVRRIAEHRSLRVFMSTFVNAPLDIDDRMRCSYNICGAETFRFSSSKNAFDTGANLQNIPAGGLFDKDDPDTLILPNIRKIFIPDTGMTFWDLDLKGADLYVVAWESDEPEFKDLLRSGLDTHVENAKALGITRQLAKVWVHGTNYGGGARTMAKNCGLTIHRAETMRKRWYQIHPGIKKWHDRTEGELKGRRYVENKFGYRRYYFDRVEGILPEALAWVPQSTVACVVNRVWVNIFNTLGAGKAVQPADIPLGSRPVVEVLLQVHDSLDGQYPSNQHETLSTSILGAAQVVVPYSDPLIIPAKLKTSTVSWGDCE